MQARCDDWLSDKVQKLRASHSDATYGNQSVEIHMAYDIADLFAQREHERFAMHQHPVAFSSRQSTGTHELGLHLSSDMDCNEHPPAMSDFRAASIRSQISCAPLARMLPGTTRWKSMKVMRPACESASISPPALAYHFKARPQNVDAD